MIKDFVFKSGEPVYVQIVDYVRTQVALGKLEADERLPPIRAFADKLGIDPGTVARAYQELDRDGTIVTRRGSGSFWRGQRGRC